MNYSKRFGSAGIAGAMLLLVACGGGGSGSGSSVEDRHTVAAAVRSGAPLAVCPGGGISVDTGIDTNGNGVLDASEVTNTQYVCNGGSGLSSLAAIGDEPAGAHCATGGKRVEVGLDDDGDGVLDAEEVSSTDYLCNGADGAHGTNGNNSLVAIDPEPAGIYCTYGGNKVSSGVDGNGNGVLDAGEVNASSYVCNGAPGPGITWEEVTGGSVQAVSNTGYMANNNTAPVAITLPAAPAYGDIVQVTGVGRGGWRVVQNAGQSIITGNVMGNIGAIWTAHDSARNWQSVASSADGTKLVAAAYAGQLYTSTDAGATWTARDSARSWRSVASSADGIKLVAAVSGGQLYTSTDSGATWTARDSARSWFSVASSADGTKLVAAINGGQLYTSTDSGVTWTVHDSARGWFSVASSADGTRLVAAAYGGQLYTSTDSGATWTARDSARNWFSVASSADGTRLVAAAYAGQLYTSTDSGATWTARDSARWWYSVASSADGNKLVAAVYGGQLYTSTDAGTTWTARDPARNWLSVASSADGTKLVAAPSGQLYTTTPTSLASTTVGAGGSIGGAQYDALDLQYIGSGTFVVRGYVGYLVVR